MITLKDIYTLSLNDIAPPNIAADENISSLITAIDPQLQQLSRASLEPLILARIDELPEQVLDLLAWQLHADFYDLAGTLSMKRQAVKGSILWHMHKGTEWAIHEALHQLDIRAEFVPWWKDGSEPYTFKLKAIVSGDFYRTQGRDKLQSSIRRAVFESKAARSYLAGLETHIEFKETLAITAGLAKLLSGERIIRLAPPPKPETKKIYLGIGTGLQGQQRILLPHEGGIHAKVYAGTATLENRDISLGVDLAEMQELLLRFEARILSRIDEYEKRILAEFEANQIQTNQKLEDIKKMLQWKGDDEELS